MSSDGVRPECQIWPGQPLPPIRLGGFGVLKTRGYNPVRFTGLIVQKGSAVAAAKQLLADPRHTFYGFERLWEMGELRRSVEFVANLPWFQPLFTDQELEAGAPAWPSTISRSKPAWQQPRPARQHGLNRAEPHRRTSP